MFEPRNVRNPLFMALIIACTCACVSISPDVIQDDASDIAYIAYRLVPDARPCLETIAAINTSLPEAEIWVQVKGELAKVWTILDKIGTDETTVAQLAINKLVTRIGLRETATTFKKYLAAAVNGVTTGVNLAVKAKAAGASS